MYINFLLAIGLAMDSLAVALSKGLTIREQRLKKALIIGVCFGLGQGLIAVIGWLIANMGISEMVKQFDHWVAFLLLAFIGGKMIYSSFKLPDVKLVEDKLSFSFVLIMTIATSIDSAAVGLSLAFVGQPIMSPAITIGLVTFVFAYTGVLVGNKLGKIFQQRVEIVGGVILIGIGVKILAEHLMI
jgi:putative Mn2+ efflux pump MntP